jgi:hypothetical protein
MRVEFRETAIAIDAETRARAERCVLLALGRFQSLVPWVSVAVAAGPARSDGPADYEVAVHVGGDRRFLVVEVNRDLTAALGRAADRARRCLERDLSHAAWRRPGVARRGRAGIDGRGGRTTWGTARSPGEPRKDEV